MKSKDEMKWKQIARDPYEFCLYHQRQLESTQALTIMKRRFRHGLIGCNYGSQIMFTSHIEKQDF